MILAEVERWLSAEGVLRSGEARVLVACSGGRDSVVLAHACTELLGARRVILGHVDHRVRPGSAEDAGFVAALAQQLGATSLVDVVSPASDAEAELRRVRYEALESQRARAQAVLIATAHTADDQAETLMLQLLRNTALDALCGIQRRRDRILRPMLDVPRVEVGLYAASRGLRWREDPSNLEPRYLRNRIRKELLPLIERRYRSGFAARLARMRTAPSSVQISEDVLLRSTPPASEGGWEGPVISMRSAAWTGGAIADGVAQAMFDADALPHPAIRNLRPGDRIQPFGMKGRTKVAEVLRAAGVPQESRAQTLLVVDEGDRVVWVPGVLRSADAPIVSETQRVWVFDVRDNAVLQAAERRVTLEVAGKGPGKTPPIE